MWMFKTSWSKRWTSISFNRSYFPRLKLIALFLRRNLCLLAADVAFQALSDVGRLFNSICKYSHQFQWKRVSVSVERSCCCFDCEIIEAHSSVAQWQVLPLCVDVPASTKQLRTLWSLLPNPFIRSSNFAGKTPMPGRSTVGSYNSAKLIMLRGGCFLSWLSSRLPCLLRCWITVPYLLLEERTGQGSSLLDTM